MEPAFLEIGPSSDLAIAEEVVVLEVKAGLFVGVAVRLGAATEVGVQPNVGASMKMDVV